MSQENSPSANEQDYDYPLAPTSWLVALILLGTGILLLPFWLASLGSD